MSDHDANVHEEIARRRVSLRNSEQKVADLLLTLPDLPTRVSMRTLARHAGVSDATVMRFCRFLGFAGYSDFKLAVARAAAPTRDREPADGSSSDEADTMITLAERIGENARTMSASEGADAIKEVAHRIAASDIVYVFAFGASRAAGWDFVHQLHYKGLKAAIVSDPHVQALRVEAMSRHSVVIFLSIGFSRLLGEMAESTREMGAFTVAITTPGTPLASACSRCILLPAAVGGQVGPPIHGRYAQLLVLDAISTRVPGAIGDHDGEPESHLKNQLRFNY